MRFGFDEINYKKTYLKYIWISILIPLLVVGLQIFVTNYLANTLAAILFPFTIVSGIYLGLSICTGLPFVIYISAKNFFRDGYIIIEDNYLQFVRTCNIVDNKNNLEDRKYKNTKYFNIVKIAETKWCYKIKGEIDYYFEKTSDRKKSPVIKHKMGIFRIPKCFGEENEFKENLYKLINSKKIETNSNTCGSYKSFTRRGVIDLVLCILGFVMAFVGSGIVVILGVTISGCEAIKGINVIREENRDRFISVINIFIGIITFLLVVLAQMY